MDKETSGTHVGRILVVDDTPANLQLLINILTGHGYTVHPASDGELALRFVQSILPDLILLDIRMPGMDGFEVCRRLKADERTRPIPIMFISILEDEHDKVKGFQAGGVDYITKPFRPDEVLARVRTHLRLRELTEHLERTVAERTEELAAANQKLLQEIMERRRVESALLESRNYLNEIINSLADPIFVKDRQHRWVLINDALCGFMGHDRDELIGKSDYDFFPRNEADVFWAKDEVVFASDQENINEEEITDARGIVHTIVTKKTLYTDVKGDQFIVGIIRDISEHKRAEALIRESEEKYRTLVDDLKQITLALQESEGRLQIILQGSPIAAFVIGKDHRVISWNDAQEQLSRVSAGSVIGTKNHWKEFYDTRRPCMADLLVDGSMEAFSQLYPGKFNRSKLITEAYEATDFFPSLGEKGKWLRSTAAPIRNFEGELIGAIETLEDITDRVDAEEQRKLLESQLAQAQKMEAIGTLAGGIAHDFNNILAAIIGYTELAKNDLQTPERVARKLDEVLKAGDRAKDLVKHILTFSRKTETQYSPLELPSIVKESLKMLRSVIPTTIEIRQKIIKSGLVLSDVTQIHQVLMNLCTNAAHAMDVTGGVLEVCLMKEDIEGEAMARNLDLTPGSYFRLTIRDTGHGMTPEVMERIFDPYFTTKEKGRGTGLGMSVVHGIVKNHRGAITCRSEPGKGTTFDIYLPELESGREPSRPLADKLMPKGTERILVIDDEPALVSMAKIMLEGLGYNVVTETSSLEAIQILKRDPQLFDLVITDMTMPGMTGDILAQKVMEVRHDLPVILCTGYSEHITEEKAKGMGIREFIMKPLGARDLSIAIRKVLDER